MKLKQIANIRAGYPFRGKIPEAEGSNVLAVQMKDIYLSHGIQWQDCLPTVLTGKRKPDYLLPGDILVAARGSHNYAVLVDITLADHGQQAVAAPHFFLVRITNRNVLPEFLAWLLNQPPTQRYLEINAEGSVTKSIRRSVLEDLPVVTPPIDKQHAIIAMANTLHQEQQLIQHLLHNGERMMSAIAKGLFDAQETRP